MEEKLIKRLMLIIAILGIVDSGYLTITHYTDTTVACPDAGIINCATVLNSPYSLLLGVPLSLWGIFFFVIEIVLLFYTRSRDLMDIYNGVGIAFVFYFLYIEYSLQAICIYCTFVHIFIVALFILSLIRMKEWGS